MAELSKTTDQALSILTHLSENGPMTASELTRSLEMNRTVVHRLLTTLHQRGFVNKQSDGYAPGVMLIRIAEQVEPELRIAARAVLADLVADIGETLVLQVVDRDDAVVLDQAVAGVHVLRVEHGIGSRNPIDKGAGGRALLAHLAPHSIERVLEHSADGAALRAELQAVRDNGFAMSHDELQEGIHGVAVPVMDRTGRAIASLGIIVPTSRSEVLIGHTELLMAGADRIGRSLAKDFGGS